jgi:hypothetical protein
MSQTEQIKYLIDAEDKATAKMNAAAAVVEQNVKQVQQLGGQSKKSTDFINVLARSMGGGEFGAFAAQIGEISEKTAQFGEVAKTGGFGALAFKAGIVGAVAVVSFKIGQSIEEWISGTKQWRVELEETLTAAATHSDFLLAKQQRNHQHQLAMNNALAEPKAREAAHLEYLDQVNEKIEQQKKEVADAKADQSEIEGTWANTLGYANEAVKVAGEHVKIEEKRLAELKNQRDSIQQIVGFKAKELELAKQIQASANFTKDLEAQVIHAKALAAATTDQARRMVEINAIAAKSGVGEDQEKIKVLLLEKDEQEKIVKQRVEGEKLVASLRNSFTEQWEKANQKIIDDQKKKRVETEKLVASLKNSFTEEWEKANQKIIDGQKQSLEAQKATVASLRDKAFELARGKEASEAMKFEQQGFDSSTANRLAKLQSELNRASGSSGVNLLTAKDDRFSTGEKEREEARQRNEIEKRTLAQAEAQRKLAESMLAELKAIAGKKETQLAVLGT